MKSCSCKVDKPELKAKLPSTQSFRAADRSLLGTRDKYCGRHHSKILNDIISIYHVSIQNIFYFLYFFFTHRMSTSKYYEYTFVVKIWFQIFT